MIGIVGGSAMPKLSVRRAIVELAYYLGQHGEAKDSIAHLAMTEGRARESNYSSCGDLIHACLFAAGCRASFVNRDEHHGWRRGENLYLYTTEHQARLTRPRPSDLRPGDACIYDYTERSAHAFIWLGIDHEGRAVTVDGGQPGVKIHRAPIHDVDHGPMLVRGRPLDHALSIDLLPFVAHAKTVGEWCQAHGLNVQPWQPAEYLADQWEDL